MTMTTPAGPMFFCAPAYIIANLLTSMGCDIIDDEKSATNGVVPTSGTVGNSTPIIVIDRQCYSKVLCCMGSKISYHEQFH
jgi:hypothetical protein